jgi:hypothetical protein
MTWLVRVGAVGALLASSLVAATAQADGFRNWGQEVKSCNQTSCYPGGGSRGSYVSGQARDSEGPGYAWEIHTLAHPGQSHPTLP